MASTAVNRRGIVLMLAAMACYAVNDAFVKLIAGGLPPGQVLAVRGAFATVVAMLIAWSARLPRAPFSFSFLLGMRCLLEITTALASVLALARAPLATTTAVMMSAPLLIGVAAAALGWEPWRGARLLIALVGFAGVLMILRPWTGFSGAHAGIGIALLCAVSLAARDLVTRRLPTAISSAAVAMLTTSAVCLAGVVIGFAEHWHAMSPSAIGCLALAALCTAFGNYALICACREADLSVVTPFRYSLVAWAALLGVLVWGEFPDLLSLGGILLICCAGLHAVRNAGRR
ncbi:MAG: DMT family transporter [Variovorax sp.]